jgi:DNA-binding NarL/FixJ family response regulator
VLLHIQIILVWHIRHLWFPKFTAWGKYSVFTMAPKRKHVTLTLKQKSEILKKIDSGQTGKNLASEYNVGASTISNIKRNRQNIKR